MLKNCRRWLIVVVSALLCITATSCLSVLSTISDIIFNFSDDLSDDDRCIVYGSDNDLAITFSDGDMLAIWDVEDNCSYELTVEKNGVKETFSDMSEPFSDGSCNLTDAGYTYKDALKLSLAQKKGTSKTEFGYVFQPLTALEYSTYTMPVSAGFTEIDSYIATRKEWFEFFSYLIVFREGVEEETDESGVSYIVDKKCLLAYDFTEYDEYASLSAEEAYANEVYSAIDAYEDSASYAYSYELGEDERTAEVYLKFYYPTDPTNETTSAQTYRNGTKPIDPAHYDLGNEHIRSFSVDSLHKTVTVSSSDQLYFTLKMGYRPNPVQGSRADYLYTEMRSVLSQINSDGDTDYTKMHHVYDYIIDTTVYDYEFTNDILKDNTDSEVLFSYKCLYMEGVFGLQADGTFSDEHRAAICDGLSKAFLCMAKIEGVDCCKISGTVRNKKSSSDTGHAWNKVKIDGVWYMVDTTWGNELGNSGVIEYLNHDYFLVKDDSSHVETPYITYPAATRDYATSGGDGKTPSFPTIKM